MDVLRELVLPKLEGVKKSGAGFMARCPAHEDRAPSLSVSTGTSHPVIFKCQAGCDTKSILDALSLTWADLCKPREQRSSDDWTPAGPAVAIYDYRDEQGELLFQVCRTAKKDFRQRRPDPSAAGKWIWKTSDIRKVIYRLPKVIQAVAECREIYIVEGEKDVHTLEAQGLVATCNPGGAGKWLPEYSEFLRDAVVIIWADNDRPGQAHARQVRDALAGIAAAITIAETAAGKDATDHFTAGHTLDDLLITWTSEQPSKPELATDLWQFLDAADAPHDWVIPGLLERGDRLILTGFEGLGKSMLVRQLAVAAAAGLDPFNTGYSNRYPARTVLFIDCENSQVQSRRKLRPIAMVTKYLDSEVPTGHMRLIHRPEGLDLTTPEDAAWLLERVTAHRPDILVIGPFYRLHAGNMNDEQFARRTVAVLDAARAVSNCALITEAHAGHGEAGKSRSVRPTGSSLLLRWPEFGYGLAPGAFAEPDERGNFRHVDVLPWRGPRDERNWPQHLEYGPPNHFPWQVWNAPRPAKKGDKT
ncbi:AAA family ATPase [Catelliglobosispora koreensis]|uniref:AAA family ATPase n=1 Tax=Catelliglobosispora koreensis TaxID=129052 RepID=UPI0003A76D08|nr:AAA family ATPase [Catelliglobosispora koreensis]